jgi:glycosyltransferase involved in cell wall biosynthesis
VLGLASLIKTAGLSHTINIVGQVPIGHEPYFQQLRDQASGLPVVWSQNLSDAQVAQVLNRSSVAYLPYPDGASDRRTTLKSAMAAGLAIITNQGAHTNPGVANSVHLSSNPQEALQGIQRLFENAEMRETLSKRAIEYSRRFSWQRIARLHLKIYSAVAPAAKSTF